MALCGKCTGHGGFHADFCKHSSIFGDVIQGVRLRDYFASAALTGLQQWDALMNGAKESAFAKSDGIDLLANLAYKVADAMLRAREAK